jgi:hypothetical protein
MNTDFEKEVDEPVFMVSGPAPVHSPGHPGMTFLGRGTCLADHTRM